MDSLIPIINKLQDVITTVGSRDSELLDLPQIVVVGTQSAGKSSVLENVVGRDFLPRGSGIVTRRPLVLQLINISPTEASAEAGKSSGLDEWGEFLHLPGKQFFDFDQIREEIQRETDRVTGLNKGISKEQINLKIYSPHVVNLTLVDLPGMTRIPVGDQPNDIEAQIRKMIMYFIEKPNAIILAVTAANTDISTSDALHLAREVDPSGLRTLGVTTKIDLMDKGTNAMDLLLGKVVPLQLGFIGVINRSQEDILAKKPIRTALQSEVAFFANHPIYRNIATKCGSVYLAKTLNKILMHHIRDCLPDLKVKINKLLSEHQSELATYGDSLYDTKNGQGALLLQVLTAFSTKYRDAIDGNLTELSTHELYGGARVNYIFNEVFARHMDTMEPLLGLSSNDIRTTIRNATGPRGTLFVPESSFELLVRKQIMRLEEPSLQCVELVYEELQRIVSQLDSKELTRFVRLRERVIEVVNGMLQRSVTPTKSMIENLIKIELAFINTSHPDFVGGDGAITSIMEEMVERKRQIADTQQNGFDSASTTQAVGGAVFVQPNSVSGAPPPSSAQAAAARGQARPPQPVGTPLGKPLQAQASGPQPPLTGTQLAQQQQQQQVAADAGGTSFLGLFNRSPVVASNAPSPTPAALPPRQVSLPPPASVRSSSQSSSSSSNRYQSRESRTTERLDQVPLSITATNFPTDKESFECELIQKLLASYFNIIRKNCKDMIPKSIMCFLVNNSKEHVQNELVRHLYKEELFSELLEESPQTAQRREVCVNMIDLLRKAHDIVNEVRDFNIR